MMVHAGAKGVDAIFVMATPFEAAGVVLLGRFKIQVAALGLRNLMSAWPAPRFAANHGFFISSGAEGRNRDQLSLGVILYLLMSLGISMPEANLYL